MRRVAPSSARSPATDTLSLLPGVAISGPGGPNSKSRIAPSRRARSPSTVSVPRPLLPGASTAPAAIAGQGGAGPDLQRAAEAAGDFQCAAGHRGIAGEAAAVAGQDGVSGKMRDAVRAAAVDAGQRGLEPVSGVGVVEHQGRLAGAELDARALEQAGGLRLPARAGTDVEGALGAGTAGQPHPIPVGEVAVQPGPESAAAGQGQAAPAAIVLADQHAAVVEPCAAVADGGA